MIYYRLPAFERHGVDLVFTSTRWTNPDGRPPIDMADAGTRKDFLERLGYRHDKLVTVQQVHGGVAILVDGSGTGRGGAVKADGIISRDNSRVLGIATADCLAIGLYSPEKKIMALLHGGWRGLVAGIIENALETMTRAGGVDPVQVSAGLGPAIGPCCYAIRDDLLGVFKASFPFWESLVTRRENGGIHADIRLLAVEKLLKYGIKPDNISHVDLCTCCNNKYFHSYRRDGKHCGRLMGFMGWKKS